MSSKLILGAVAILGLASCGVEQERQVVLPQSENSVLPWNIQQEGEGLGQFGALQRLGGLLNRSQ